MKRFLLASVAFIVLAATGIAVADLSIKDGGGATVTMLDFICVVSGSKHCSASVNVDTTGAYSPIATQAQMTSLISAVNGPIPTGSSVIGKVGIDQTTPGTTNAVQVIGTLPALGAGSANIGLVSPQPIAAGACAPYHLAGGTAATNNATNIKSTAGVLCEMTAINTTATVYYLKVYDATAAPTCSSATGLKHVYPLLSTGGLQRTLNFGENFTSGISFCVTAGGADTDNTSAVTGVYIEASYK